MLIGELSKRSGFSRDTIRYYEKEGWIRVGRRDRMVNNYKDYPEAILEKLLLIKKLKGLGFTLNESAYLIAMMEENQATCNNISMIVNDKITVINEKILQLARIRNTLMDSLHVCPGGSDPSLRNQCSLLLQVLPGNASL